MSSWIWGNRIWLFYPDNLLRIGVELIRFDGSDASINIVLTLRICWASGTALQAKFMGKRNDLPKSVSMNTGILYPRRRCMIRSDQQQAKWNWSISRCSGSSTTTRPSLLISFCPAMSRVPRKIDSWSLLLLDSSVYSSFLQCSRWLAQ